MSEELKAVLEALPEEVRPFGEEYVQTWPSGIEEPLSKEMLEHMAWSRWARSKSNEELAGVVMWCRRMLVGDGHNVLADQLEHAALRLRYPRKFRQRVK